MYCLDTNVVIDIFRGDKDLRNRISSIDPSITTITLCELFKGVYLSSDSEKSLMLVQEFVKSVDIINLDEKSCHIYGKDYQILKKSGKLIQDLDLIIASIVKVHDFVLLTRNKKDFQDIPDLKVEEW